MIFKMIIGGTIGLIATRGVLKHVSIYKSLTYSSKVITICHKMGG